MTDRDALGARLRAALADDFEVGECLGQGGFAAVFRARDRMLGRDVAIKVLDPDLTLGADTTERFLTEARTVAAIEHPHIVPLYEAGMRDGLVFLVMRFLAHGTLADRMDRGPRLTPQEAAARAREVAEALSAAHARGIIHRDVKPENVLLDADARAVVTDFGIALVGAEAQASEQGFSTGTPAYMSPEQVTGDAIDARTDVYSLGVVLYTMLGGRLPISGASARQVMANQVSQQPIALAAIDPSLPRALCAVAERALAKDPADRYPSAAAMAEALRAASSDDALLPPREVQKRARRRWYRRVGLVASGAVVVLVGVVYMIVRVAAGFLDPTRAPAVNLLAPAIPAAMERELRATGRLVEGDSILWVFVPHDDSLRNALVWTNQALVPVGHARPLRYEHTREYKLDVRRENRNGLLLVRHPGSQATDTLFTGLSIRDQTDLLAALSALSARAGAARPADTVP